MTALGSLIYNVCMKLGTGSVNAFSYVLIMGVFTFLAQALFYLVARYGFKVDTTTGLSRNALLLCAAGGFAVAIIDICYFYALRHGSVVASQMFWTVGGTLALVLFATFFFKEPLTQSKIAGIALGFASIYLMTRQG